ncbi:hypothetical protein GCM10011375_37900 [Hymenobacter qilianensis]|uniref:Uncharacterized protein n=1 Tax=Hymenobacter qilianensis TaxID=1385715 RepID=A0ACB5PWR7_9BACT|nr:hypothetical protein GCM10011375_37900 [Hymenobacter qilianensis]
MRTVTVTTAGEGRWTAPLSSKAVKGKMARERMARERGTGWYMGKEKTADKAGLTLLLRVA